MRTGLPRSHHGLRTGPEANEARVARLVSLLFRVFGHLLVQLCKFLRLGG